MRRLTKYISHMKDLHSLNEYLNEKLVVNKDFKEPVYAPKTWDELRKIIEDRYDKLGTGTKKNPIDFNDVDVSGMTLFYNDKIRKGIFEDTNFKYIDISDWDMSNIEYMNCMFWGCAHLKSIGDISNWKISNVMYMGSMFRNCENLTFVGDLSKWDVSNIRGMSYMFTNSGITNIPDWYKE